MTSFNDPGLNPLAYTGVRANNPANVIQATRAPTTTDVGYQLGTLWVNTTAQSSYQLDGFSSGAAVWVVLGGGTSDVNTINNLSPTGGNITIAGTANQITMTSAGSTVTASIPSAFTAPGSITATTTVASTTTMTAGTGLTATTGNITATTGNFVASAAGQGILLNSSQASGAAASPVVVNGRSGRATFTSVSIAAAADLTLTITNSSITASTTEVLISMSGATTGSALSIKSKTASSGSLAIVVTNGTGATTTTADIQIDFLVLNA